LDETTKQLVKETRVPIPAAMQVVRRLDRAIARRVDRFVAISHAVAERIQRAYGLQAPVIYPPVEVQRQRIASQVEDYYLVLSRLAPYKRIDLAVEACTRLALPLVIIGDGRDLPRLRAMAGPTVKFLGFIADDDAVQRYVSRCRAFLFPGEEDFGITPVEAQASGRPVIAYAAGGALDTVLPGQTGELFAEQTVDSLSRTLRAFDPARYDPGAIRRHALRFDSDVFKTRLREFLEGVLYGA
ncbi:MAG: glycosyltransferase, partial [Chloroflexota bacterium]